MACTFRVIGFNRGFYGKSGTPPIKGFKTTSLEKKTRLLHWKARPDTDRVDVVDVSDFGSEPVEKKDRKMGGLVESFQLFAKSTAPELKRFPGSDFQKDRRHVFTMIGGKRVDMVDDVFGQRQRIHSVNSRVNHILKN
jgi:hypothetical protein